MSKFFIIPSLLFFLFLSPLFGKAQISNEHCSIVGKIKVINENSIIVNDQSYYLDEDVVVIYQSQFNSKIIPLEGIIDDQIVKVSMNDRDIVNVIEISGENLFTGLAPSGEQLLEWEETIYSFEIDYNGNFIAYYSLDDQCLYIKEIATGETLWKNKHSSPPLFKWQPYSSKLIYSLRDAYTYGINSFDIINMASEQLFSQPLKYNEQINLLELSSLDNSLAFTVIQGDENSHGYILAVYILDTKNNIIKIAPLFNVNQLTWSNDNRFLALSQLSENDYITNRIVIYDLLENNYYYLTEDKINNQNPLFSPDNSRLIFTQTQGIVDIIFKYDFVNKTLIKIVNDYSYISDLTWLNENTLLYTTGHISHITLIDINSRDILTSFKGFNPRITDKYIYFLNNKDEKTILVRLEI